MTVGAPQAGYRLASILTPALVSAPPPPTPENLGGVPLGVWSNLPLITCAVFAVFIAIGLILIIRKNRQIAREQLAQELAQLEQQEES